MPMPAVGPDLGFGGGEQAGYAIQVHYGRDDAGERQAVAPGRFAFIAPPRPRGGRGAR